jgi:redox-sensitive bicupin YhaK (pirin superfamily)
MTAGRGIVHSEMPEQEDGLMWGFQLWVNLPAADKLTAPRYQEFEPGQVPVAELPGGVSVHVVAGKVGNVTGPVAGIATAPTYLDIELPAGASAAIDLPPSQNAFAYPFEGEVRIGDRIVPRGTLAVLGNGDRVILGAAGAPARVLLVAGQPLKEPVARYGPFVMNTPEQIRQAIADYQAGRF